MKRLKLRVQLQAVATLRRLLAAGFALREGLAYLQVALPKQKVVWASLQETLEAGGSLATGLAALRFHPLIVTQVTLAEAHGDQAQALEHAERYVRLQTTQTAKLRQLLVYPAVLLGLLALLQGALVLGFLPAMQLEAGGNWRYQAFGYGLLLVVLTVGGLGLRRATPQQRFLVGMRLPGVRGVVVAYYQYQFVAGATQFLDAGQDLIAYCRILATLPKHVLQPVGQAVTTALANGANLPAALNQPLVYPPLAALVALGQSEALVQAGTALFAKDLFWALTARLERLVALLQPVLFAVIGVQIVLVYLDILAPLYNSL